MRPDVEDIGVLIENCLEGIAGLDGEGTIRYESLSVEHILGYKQKELIGRNLLEFVHPDDVPSVLAAFRHSPSRSCKERTVNVTARFLHKNGSWRTIEAVGNDLLDDSRVNGIVVNYRDVTEHALANEALSRSEKYFRSLIENALDAVLILDGDGTIQYSSPSSEHLLGYRPGEQVGTSGLGYVWADDLSDSAEMFAHLMENPGATIHTEVRGRHKDGSTRTLEVVGKNLLDDHSVGGIVVNLRDITDRKLAQQALLEREERFRALIENSLDGIAIADARGTILYESPSVKRIAGYDPADLVGRRMIEFVHADDVPAVGDTFRWLIDHSGETASIEARFQHKDGSWRTLEAIECNLLHDPRVNGIVINYRDITERRTAEAELRLKEKALEHSISAIAMSDMEGRITYVNRACLALWGNDNKEELVGKPYWRLLEQPSEVAVAKEIVISMLRKGFWEGELAGISKTGKRLHVHVLSSILRDDQGNPIHTISSFIDITERRKALEALQKSEEKLRQYLESSPDAIYINDLKGRLLYGNMQAEKLTGYDKNELMGKSFVELDLLTPEYLEKAKNVLERNAAGSPSGPDEFAMRRKDGSLVFVEISTYPIGEGDDIEVIGIARDIGERKSMENALRESEARFRTVFEGSAIGIALLDATVEPSRLVEVNQAFERMLGYNLAEIRGMKSPRHLHPEDGLADAPLFQKMLEGKTDRYTIEKRFIKKDGRVLWGRQNLSMARGPNGEPKYIIAMIEDITERREAEEKLRESEEKLARYLESSPDIICVVDLQGTILYVNRVAEQVTGYSRDELLGRQFTSLPLVAPSEVAKPTQWLEQGGAERPESIEYVLTTKAGDRILVEISTYPMRLGEGTEVIAIGRDVTERRRAEEERNKMEQQLQLAGRLASVGQLAAGVAHELNNPLAAVQAYAQLLAASKGIDESIRRDVDTIYREAQRATRITQNLLSFARKHKPEKGFLSINEIVEKSLELHAYRMKVNNIEVEMDLDPDLPMTMADFHQMQQVFVNIVTNAEQAMTEAHGKGRLLVSTRKAGEMIRVTFADDGPGISEDDRERIFDPFFTTKGVGKGTGLGLSISYGIVQEHGGTLYARSRLREGTAFVVEIPIIGKDDSGAGPRPVRNTNEI